MSPGGAHFIIYQDAKKEWRWRLIAGNGNVLADSGEGYTKKADAEKGVEFIRNSAASANIVVA